MKLSTVLIPIAFADSRKWGLSGISSIVDIASSIGNTVGNLWGRSGGVYDDQTIAQVEEFLLSIDNIDGYPLDRPLTLEDVNVLIGVANQFADSDTSKYQARFGWSGLNGLIDFANEIGSFATENYNNWVGHRSLINNNKTRSGDFSRVINDTADYGNVIYICDDQVLSDVSTFEEVVNVCASLDGELLFGYVKYGYAFPSCEGDRQNTTFFDEGNALFEEINRSNIHRAGIVFEGDMSASCDAFVKDRYVGEQLGGYSRTNSEGTLFTGSAGESLGEVNWDNVQVMSEFCETPAEYTVGSLVAGPASQDNAWSVDLTRYIHGDASRPLYPNIALNCSIDNFDNNSGVFFQTISEMKSLISEVGSSVQVEEE